MKLNEREFNKKVAKIRRMMPYYNNGRKVVVLGENTNLGQQIIAIGSRWEGNWLNQVYSTPSETKQRAFDDAWEMYINSRNGESFGICSHNCYNFTVSWLHDDGLTVLTSKTEYLVIFNE